MAMNKSESDQSFQSSEGSEGEESINLSEVDSHSSNNLDNDDGENNHPSLDDAWPRSYRKSIDMYACSVPSPSDTHLLRRSLTDLWNSSTSSIFKRRHTHHILPTSSRTPLIEDKKLDERCNSHSFVLPSPTRKSSINEVTSDWKMVAHELNPSTGRSSIPQALLNSMNMLCGVGILSTAYGVKEGGWLGLSILVIYAILSCYTGFLLRYCLDSQPGLATYPDIGGAAFGKRGRIGISIVLYMELYASCVEYINLDKDNLASLFPNAHKRIGGFKNSENLFAMITTVALLFTVYIQDLSLLSYLSAGGVVASVLVVACLFWVGLVDGVALPTKGTLVKFSNLPVSIGLYAFCYSGHSVFPNIYTSMENRNQFPVVLLMSFIICTSMYVGVAVMGYLSFGESTKSQFTLNMPQGLVASNIAVWTTVVNPFTKYPLTILPVALCIEELIPPQRRSVMYSILIRTGLVLSTYIVASEIPFFGLMMALIGSVFTMLVTLIFPCACYLSIFRGNMRKLQVAMCWTVIFVGVISSAFGSYSAVVKIIEALSDN